MSKEKNKKPIAVVIGTTFAVSLLAGSVAHAAENPFSISDRSASYTIADAHGEEAGCGEGKCGDEKGKDKEGCCGDHKKKAEGSCGEGKCGDGAKKEEEGKCGEGRCGDGGGDK